MVDVIIRYGTNFDGEVAIRDIHYVEEHHSWFEIDIKDFEKFILKNTTVEPNTLNLILLKLNIKTYQGMEDMDVNISYEIVSQQLLKNDYDKIVKAEIFERLKTLKYRLLEEYGNTATKTILDSFGDELYEYENLFGVLIEDDNLLVEAIEQNTLEDLECFSCFKINALSSFSF